MAPKISHARSAATTNFRVLTYNIHKGIGGLDRRYRLNRIISVIDGYHPDIVLLQEVDDGVPRSRGDRQVDVIADALDFEFRAFQKNVTLTRGGYGNAMVSRFPLHDVHSLDLSVRLKKRRRALVAWCTLPGEPEHRTLLLNCHLGLAAYERRIQVDKLLKHVANKHASHPHSHILGGDFNDSWRAIGARLVQPMGYETPHSKAPTFPAMFPMRKLDHVYYRGGLHAINSFVGRTQLARQASDHLPLIVDFDVMPAAVTSVTR